MNVIWAKIPLYYLRLWRITVSHSRPIVGREMSDGLPGSGVGKGGGTGGTIRDAGGAFGKKEAVQEEQYIRKLQKEQLLALKKSLEKEVDFHKQQIEAHKQALERHKERLEDLTDKSK